MRAVTDGRARSVSLASAGRGSTEGQPTGRGGAAARLRWPSVSDVSSPRDPATYGEGERVVEIHSGTAVWRHAGLPVVPIRWVLLRDPSRRFDPQALLCSDLGQDAVQIVRWFV